MSINDNLWASSTIWMAIPVPTLLVLAIFTCSTVGVAGYSVWQEQSHYLDAGLTDETRVDAFLNGSRRPGLSSMTRSRYLRDCANAVISRAGLNLSAQTSRRLREQCLTQALLVTADDPNSSLGWYIAAFSSLALDDYSGMNRYLAQAYATGRNEGYLAMLRVQLVEGNIGRVDDSLMTQHAHDIALLVNGIGRDLVADIYVRDADARARITEAVEVGAASHANDFVNAVQRATQRLRSGSAAP